MDEPKYKKVFSLWELKQIEKNIDLFEEKEIDYKQQSLELLDRFRGGITMLAKIATGIGVLLAIIGVLSDNMPIVCSVGNALFSSVFDNPCYWLTKIVGTLGAILAGLSKGLLEWGNTNGD